MTRLLGLTLFLAATLFLINSSVTAQDEPKKGKIEIETLFKKLDANKDGKLTKDEFLKLASNLKNKDKVREMLGMTFDKIDPEMKGVSLEQFRTFIDAKKKEKKPQ
ncbi:MAG: EF-hand domain-containing protein [Gemmataceae bacterium]|nr:EF-hand domain-containing protein [Gemmataceae bacterium]